MPKLNDTEPRYIYYTRLSDGREIVKFTNDSSPVLPEDFQRDYKGMRSCAGLSMESTGEATVEVFCLARVKGFFKTDKEGKIIQERLDW